MPPIPTPKENTMSDNLITAWHAVFDFKDTQPAGYTHDWVAYNALGAIESILAALGIPKPKRFDSKGDPEPPSLRDLAEEARS